MKLLLSHCADNHPEESPVEFCVSFWNVMASAKDQGNYFEGWDRERVLEYWSSYAKLVDSKYVIRKNYLRVNGRPVLQFGYVHTWRFYEAYNVQPSDISNAIREVIPDAYLLATATERETYPSLKSWGFDGFTEYLLHGKGWDATMETYRWSWSQGIQTAKTYNLTYWVPFTSGYDGTAWDTPESHNGYSHIPTPAQFTAHVREAKKLSSDNSRYTGARTIGYSLNEFGESKTPIEPTERNGYAYLEALRAA